MRYTLPLHRAALWGSARPPQAAYLNLELLLAMRALRQQAVVTVLVYAAIEILQVGQVGGVHLLDYLRVDVLDGAELTDHSRQQYDQQVSRIALHTRVLEGCNLVEGGRKPHHAFSVDVAVAIAVTLWQREGKFRLHKSPRSEEHTSELQSLAYLVC